MSHDHYVHKVRAGVPDKPIFFVFHGTGGDENQFFDFASGLMPDATIVSPRGDVSEHGAARFFKRKAEGLYDLDDLARGTRRMADFLTAMRALYKSTRVIGLGFSNGANILANVLIEKPEIFDAAVLMHPLIPFEPMLKPAASTRRVLITAGQRDPICPVPLTEALGAFLERQGGEVTFEWHPGGHEIRSAEIEAVRGFIQPYL